MKSVRIEGEEVVLVTDNLHNTGMLATLILLQYLYCILCVCMYVFYLHYLLVYSYLLQQIDLKFSDKFSLCEFRCLQLSYYFIKVKTIKFHLNIKLGLFSCFCCFPARKYSVYDQYDIFKREAAD